MYYLQKSGIYLHGVFWIGESLAHGIIEANKHADSDEDSYHDWELTKYSYGFNHKVVYSTNHGESKEIRDCKILKSE